MYKTRTNIVLDESLVGEAFRFTEVKTKRELVDLALRELRGKVRLDSGYEHKSLCEVKG